MLTPLHGQLSPLTARLFNAPGTNLLAGLMAFWELDEASGDRLDKGTNALTLSSTGVGQSPGVSSGDFSANFPTGFEGLSTVDKPALDFTGDFSISMWAKVAAWSTTGNWLVNKRGNAGDGEFQLIIYHAGGDNPYFTAHTPDFSQGSIIQSSHVVTFGNWFHIYAEWDHAVHQANLSYNNNAMEFGNINASAVVTHGPGPFAVGAGAWSFTNNVGQQGDMAEVGIWTRKLTVAERSALYNSGAGKHYSSF